MRRVAAHLVESASVIADAEEAADFVIRSAQVVVTLLRVGSAEWTHF